MGLERARFGARILERMVALGTARGLVRGRRSPISTTAGQGQILQQVKKKKSKKKGKK